MSARREKVMDTSHFGRGGAIAAEKRMVRAFSHLDVQFIPCVNMLQILNVVSFYSASMWFVFLAEEKKRNKSQCIQKTILYNS
jgi:hypothetical protein